MLPTRRRLLGSLSALALSGTALAGCAATAARLEPRVGPPVEATRPPDDRFTMTDGAVLPVRVWRPAGTPVANVLALHGFNDSRDAWEYPAPALTRAGFAIHAPDQRGFGATASRGIWPGTQGMVDDAQACLRLLRARDPSTPLFLVGESMGGAVAMLVAAAPAVPLAGTALLAPAVWGREEMSPAYTSALWVAANLAPGYQVTGREVPVRIRASDNREALIRLAEDPLTLRSTSLRSLRGLVDLMDAALAAAPRMPPNALFLGGARDQVVPQHATAAMWRRLPGTPRRARYADGYHLLLRDRHRAIPTDDLAAWMTRPAAALPSGAELAAAAWLADGEA